MRLFENGFSVISLGFRSVISVCLSRVSHVLQKCNFSCPSLLFEALGCCNRVRTTPWCATSQTLGPMRRLNLFICLLLVPAPSHVSNKASKTTTGISTQKKRFTKNPLNFFQSLVAHLQATQEFTLSIPAKTTQVPQSTEPGSTQPPNTPPPVTQPPTTAPRTTQAPEHLGRPRGVTH